MQDILKDAPPLMLLSWYELYDAGVLCMVPRKTGGWRSWRETGRRPPKVDPSVLHDPSVIGITLHFLQ
jgi:hypothetical protein